MCKCKNLKIIIYKIDNRYRLLMRILMINQDKNNNNKIY